MIDSLMACHLGTAIYSCHKKTMKLTYNIDRGIAANAKAAAARAKQARAEASRALVNQTTTAQADWLCDLGNEGCHVQGKISQVAFGLEIAGVQNDGF